MKYPHVAARIFNTPLLIHPQKLEAIVAGLGPRLLGGSHGDLHIGNDMDVPAAIAAAAGPELFSTRKGDRVKEAGWPGYRNVDGVAVVNANGALVHKTAFDMNASELLLGYNDLAAAMEHAADNPDIHAVLQVWDSPGGEVQGAFEYAQRVFDLRGKKPMYSIADGMAASAAMLGASATHQVAVTETGYVGSIGVVMRHVNMRRAVEQAGFDVDHIYAGAHKVDGNPIGPLTPAVRAAYQAQIDDIYSMFVSVMSRHMNLPEEAVRNTEARVFMGKAAVDAGLAARVTTTDALLTELAADRPKFYPAGGSGMSNQKGTQMSATQAAAGGNQPANQPPAAAFTQTDLDNARAAGRAEGHAAGVKEGTEQTLTAERARVSAILTHKETEGRGALAVQCVANGLSVEASASLLAAAPKATGAAAAAAPFAAAMAQVPNPKVAAGGGDDAVDDEPAAITATWNKALRVDKPATKH
jgi:signal peptide peptidase SppA